MRHGITDTSWVTAYISSASTTGIGGGIKIFKFYASSGHELKNKKRLSGSKSAARNYYSIHKFLEFRLSHSDATKH